MIRLRLTPWRRDLLVGLLASLLTASVLVPLGWAAVREQRDQADVARKKAEAVALRAEQSAVEAAQQRALAKRNLIDQALDSALLPGFADRSEAEVRSVTTSAVAPEIPEGAHVLIDKKASSFAVGDIVIYRVEGNYYLGRVVVVDKASGRLTVGRNGEPDRQVLVGDVVGRGVLNTR